MAAEKICVSSKLQDIANKMKGYSEEISTYENNLGTELDSINESWQGADATAYTKKMRDDYAVLLKGFIDSLDSYVEFLSHVYEKYEEFDNNREEIEI